MTARTLHPLAEAYLDRLETAAGHLPRDRRRELVDEIETHLFEALGPSPSEAEVRNALDRLGTPEEIAEAEGPRPVPAGDPRGGKEWAAIILLLLGGFVFGVGWIAGLILLWGSKAWSTRDKLIGSLLWPGGLAGVWFELSLYFISGQARVCSPQCSDDPTTVGEVAGLIALVAALVVPFVTAFYLARRAKRSTILSEV